MSDIRQHFPDAAVDWVVEENFAELPALHPGVRQVIPVAVRRWRRTLFKPAVWREMARFKRRLQSPHYDLVLDSQGLIKSAAITLLARGPHCGYDRTSAREALAALAYDRSIAIPRKLHAVERNRLLAGRALGYEPADAVDYGIAAPSAPLSWLAGNPYVVLLHATSRIDKEWPEHCWVELASRLDQRGVSCILPWGGEHERDRSERLARQMHNAVVPPRLNLAEAAKLLDGARAVAGVDTGLTHLAAALRVPVVALYLASEPGLTGVYSSGAAINLGGAGQQPLPAEVGAALTGIMRT